MYSKSGNTEVMTYDISDEIIAEHFDLLLSRYQISLETQVRGSDFIFNGVNQLYYKCHKVNFKPSGSYIELDKKGKKAIINGKNDDDVFNIQQQFH